ncbi:MAG: alpha/beta fold hydrolase, partial [Candidatus Micrarchaeota archaeon]|nr:alpha/beta fold hydrolase [Candidatus Micrarchaeota archaeon]
MSISKLKFPPYRKGFLAVGDGHKLYYEFYGNPKGIPVLFVHGGPGGGFKEKHKGFIDKKKYNLILFEQRGSGRSKPHCSLKANTTQKLVEDIHKLLKFAGVKRAILFGGSWGSTLALCYAIKYSETVSAMVLRGIFLATKKEINYYYNGGTKTHFPEYWERFIANVPANKRGNAIGYYLQQMLSKNKQTAKKYRFEWKLYESALSKLHFTHKDFQRIESEWIDSIAILEAHYMKNNCFLADNYILNNVKKIEH